MTRHEADREDLLRDATALKKRIAFRTPDGGEVFVGFRASCAASIYLDQDPAYHFNSAGQLRRAYVDGYLLKAVRGQLVRMHRQRPGGEVQLVSRPLNKTETGRLLEKVLRELQTVRDALRDQKYLIVGEVPKDSDVQNLALDWLEQQCEQAVEVAPSPHAR